MGISIAEMLGMDMPEEEPAEEASQPDDVQGVVVAALLAESEVRAEDFREDMRLEEDFDLDLIGLYAVVAGIEQDLKVTLPDSKVRELVTLGDLFALVRSARA
ncbi:MAG: acyl carrier protein [Actinomycetaceae bacterium]|nr:acyl carrier protein [Actinomycetaceae bacterium]